MTVTKTGGVRRYDTGFLPSHVKRLCWAAIPRCRSDRDRAMLAGTSSSKSAQTRFNLLLLEDGEFFLDVRAVAVRVSGCPPCL